MNQTAGRMVSRWSVGGWAPFIFLAGSIWAANKRGILEARRGAATHALKAQIEEGFQLCSESTHPPPCDRLDHDSTSSSGQTPCQRRGGAEIEDRASRTMRSGGARRRRSDLGPPKSFDFVFVLHMDMSQGSAPPRGECFLLTDSHHLPVPRGGATATVTVISGHAAGSWGSDWGRHCNCRAAGQEGCRVFSWHCNDLARCAARGHLTSSLLPLPGA